MDLLTKIMKLNYKGGLTNDKLFYEVDRNFAMNYIVDNFIQEGE